MPVKKTKKRKTVKRGRAVEGGGNAGLAGNIHAPPPATESPPQVATGALPPEVIKEIKPGVVIQKKDYVVEIISLEKGHNDRDMVRYRKGFLTDSGIMEWGPDVLGDTARIGAWLLKGSK